MDNSGVDDTFRVGSRVDNLHFDRQVSTTACFFFFYIQTPLRREKSSESKSLRNHGVSKESVVVRNLVGLVRQRGMLAILKAHQAWSPLIWSRVV